MKNTFTVVGIGLCFVCLVSFGVADRISEDPEEKLVDTNTAQESVFVIDAIFGAIFETWTLYGTDIESGGKAELISKLINPGLRFVLKERKSRAFFAGRAVLAGLATGEGTGISTDSTVIWSGTLGWEWNAMESVSVEPSLSLQKRLFIARQGNLIGLEGTTIPSFDVNFKITLLTGKEMDLGAIAGGSLLFGRSSGSYDVNSGWAAQAGAFLNYNPGFFPLIAEVLVERREQDTTSMKLASWQTSLMVGIRF